MKGRLPGGVTIYNALRVALRIISGKIILNFAFVALCGALQTHFHGRGRNEKRQLPRRFLRKHGAAGENFLTVFRGKTLSVIARDASSPERGSFICTDR